LVSKDFKWPFLLLHDWIPLPPFERFARCSHGALFAGDDSWHRSQLAFSSHRICADPQVDIVRQPEMAADLSPVHIWTAIYRRTTSLVDALSPSARAEASAEYHAMYGRTHGFLPVRNGIRINTLHFVLHAATLTTFVVLVFACINGT
jgi:hypothetical protein